MMYIFFILLTQVWNYKRKGSQICHKVELTFNNIQITDKSLIILWTVTSISVYRTDIKTAHYRPSWRYGAYSNCANGPWDKLLLHKSTYIHRRPGTDRMTKTTAKAGCICGCTVLILYLYLCWRKSVWLAFLYIDSYKMLCT